MTAPPPLLEAPLLEAGGLAKHFTVKRGWLRQAATVRSGIP